MKQELAWGTAATVAIVAALGISSQPGSKSNPSDDGQSRKAAITTKIARETAAKGSAQPQCADSVELLEHFFLHEKITGPDPCYGEKHPSTPLPPKFQTKFIIATLPDPLHTHFSLQFDRYIEAVQQGAQDEHYTYDSSWLPWETEEQSYSSMKDQDAAEDRKAKREAQPGILLFRGPDPAPGEENLGVTPYQKALIVFVVGEETTGGIHREQFENAVAWIKALQPASETGSSVAILGPSSSGSFPSLSDLLSKTGLLADNKSQSSGKGENRLAVYSGGTSSRNDGLAFSQTKGIDFRSFVRDDMTALDLLCRYFAPNGSPQNLAILSEDETAYGYSETAGKVPDENPRKGATPTPKDALAYPRDSCGEAPIKVFYPRDISTLRAAYQNQSMFSSGSGIRTTSSARACLQTYLTQKAGNTIQSVPTRAIKRHFLRRRNYWVSWRY